MCLSKQCKHKARPAEYDRYDVRFDLLWPGQQITRENIVIRTEPNAGLTEDAAKTAIEANHGLGSCKRIKSIKLLSKV